MQVCNYDQVEDAIEWSKKTHQVEFIQLSEAEKVEWDSKLLFLTDKWIQSAKEKGFPAEDIVADIKAFSKMYSGQ